MSLRFYMILPKQYHRLIEEWNLRFGLFLTIKHHEAIEKMISPRELLLSVHQYDYQDSLIGFGTYRVCFSDGNDTLASIYSHIAQNYDSPEERQMLINIQQQQQIYIDNAKFWYDFLKIAFKEYKIERIGFIFGMFCKDVESFYLKQKPLKIYTLKFSDITSFKDLMKIEDNEITHIV